MKMILKNQEVVEYYKNVRMMCYADIEFDEEKKVIEIIFYRTRWYKDIR